MKCIKCGNDLPEAGVYCPSCGTVNERQATIPPVKSKTKPIIYVTAALAAVGLVALIVAVVLAQRGNVTAVAPGTPAPAENVLAVPPGKPADSGLMTVPPGTEGKGDVTPSATPKPKPTPAMVDYLRFLKEMDARRTTLAKDKYRALGLAAQGIMGLYVKTASSGEDPWAPVVEELDKQQAAWLGILQHFDKAVAPPECRSISRSYREVLRSQSAATVKAAASVKSIKPSKTEDVAQMIGPLQEMLDTTQAEINAAVDAADSDLDELVSQYDMEKPFTVYREKEGSGNLLGL